MRSVLPNQARRSPVYSIISRRTRGSCTVTDHPEPVETLAVTFFEQPVLHIPAHAYADCVAYIGQAYKKITGEELTLTGRDDE